MDIHKYISNYRAIQEKILEYIKEKDNSDKNFSKLIKLINDQKIKEDKHDFKLFLHLLASIFNNHHRDFDFFEKIFKIIIQFKDVITQKFTNIEIFQIFKKNKRVLLFLIEEKMIVIDDEIVDQMEINDYFNKYIDYFTPELKDRIKFHNSHSKPQDQENFDEKRKNGENCEYICELIRKDSLDEFIAYINKMNIDLKTCKIQPSIFETNVFLYYKNYGYRLIEYSIFYGSIKIFKYLIMNNVDLKPLYFLNAIHSKNGDIIHILEERELVEDQSYTLPQDEDSINKLCVFEAIKCHHNDLANYFLNKTEIDPLLLLQCCLHYYNFEFIDEKLIQNNVFYSLVKFDYFNFVKFLLEEKADEIDVNIKQVFILIFLNRI